MSRHLKLEEFMDLLEGTDLRKGCNEHLNDCSQCRSTLTSISELQEDISSMNHELAEIDWVNFRSSVRNTLLSRSVKRSSRFQRFTGWCLRPEAAWRLALLLVVTVAVSGGVLHYTTQHSNKAIVNFVAFDTSENFPGTAVEETELIEAEVIAWSQTELFDSLNDLEGKETAKLLELLKSVEDAEFNFSENDLP